MGQYLHRLGVVIFRHPWRVISAWVIILVLLIGSALYFIRPTSSAISIPGTDAQVAIDRAEKLFKGSGGGSGRIVFEARNDTKINNHQKTIDRLVKEVGKVEGVSAAISPFVDASFISQQGTIAYAQVQLKGEAGSVNKVTLDAVMKKVAAARTKDLRIEAGGDLISRNPGEIIGIGEVGGVLIALMVLIITFGSLVAAGMPLVSAILAVGVSMAGLFSMSQLFEISNTTPVLAVMLGLAVGIDYSLFIINKYRSYLLSGYDFEYAAARALGTAGNAVVFAAVTVVIALAALSVVNVPFMTTMGLVGAGSVAVSALVAITLTPALLRITGEKIFGKKLRQSMAHAQTLTRRKTTVNRHSLGYRWGKILAGRPVVVLIIGLIIVGIIALPARSLTLGLPTDQYAAKDTTQRKAYDMLSDGFGVGFNAPLTLVVEGLPKVSESDRNAVRSVALDELNKQITAASVATQAEINNEIAMAITPEQQLAVQQKVTQLQIAAAAQKKKALAQIEVNVTKYAKFVQLKKVADKLDKYKNVQKTLLATATNDGTAGIIQVIPGTAPASQATKRLIKELRSSSIQRELSGSNAVTFAVTGSVALQDDINQKLADALPVYLAVIVGLSLLLLIVAFRSVVVPIKATLGFLLSVLAMFGAIVAVFQWGWLGIAEAPGPIVSFIPIIAIGILFGLAMDYEFFLVSGMHEAYSHGKSSRDAVVEGFGLGSKVVAAAAAIMISVFGGFITNHDATIQSIGLGLAVGILVDAFVVRMTIVPAVMALLGDVAWWLPKWLDKRLPRISIEGEE